jgi:hypothetical protein
MIDRSKTQFKICKDKIWDGSHCNIEENIPMIYVELDDFASQMEFEDGVALETTIHEMISVDILATLSKLLSKPYDQIKGYSLSYEQYYGKRLCKEKYGLTHFLTVASMTGKIRRIGFYLDGAPVPEVLK